VPLIWQDACHSSVIGTLVGATPWHHVVADMAKKWLFCTLLQAALSAGHLCKAACIASAQDASGEHPRRRPRRAYRRAVAPPHPASLCLPCQPLLLCSCERQRAPLRVAVLLSGGVDSSLALALLKAAGHDVRAFYLKIWFQEDFRNFWDACPWEEDLRYAQQVRQQCAQLSYQPCNSTIDYMSGHNVCGCGHC
jgi:tRNA methyl transferase